MLRAPIPPLSVQQRFAAFVWAALKSKSRQVSAEHNADDLFAALLHRAFRGELTSSESAPSQLSIFAAESKHS